jgi:hypothetical protein
MADYKPDLPAGVSLPPGFKVDTGDPRYVALRDLATREKLSQSAFSQILGVEAARINAEYERARATPAAAPAPAPKPDFSKMSTRDQMAYALQRGAPPRRGSW